MRTRASLITSACCVWTAVIALTIGVVFTSGVYVISHRAADGAAKVLFGLLSNLWRF